MTPQPAQPNLNVKKLIPFFVLGGLIILGVVASAIFSQSRNDTANTSISESDQPPSYIATDEIAKSPELQVLVSQPTGNNSLSISLDSGTNDLTQAISFSIELQVSPVITATEIKPSDELIESKWAYPVTILENKNGGTSIRMAGYNIKSSDLNGITELATINLDTPIDLKDLNISLIPRDSIAFVKSGTQYQLVLAQ